MVWYGTLRAELENVCRVLPHNSPGLRGSSGHGAPSLSSCPQSRRIMCKNYSNARCSPRELLIRRGPSMSTCMCGRNPAYLKMKKSPPKKWGFSAATEALYLATVPLDTGRGKVIQRWTGDTYLGALHLSANTAEMTAMTQAMLLLNTPPSRRHSAAGATVHLFADSTYTLRFMQQREQKATRVSANDALGSTLCPNRVVTRARGILVQASHVTGVMWWWLCWASATTYDIR